MSEKPPEGKRPESKGPEGKRVVRVAAAQITPVLDRPGGTLDKVLNTVADAAAKGVRFLVFPETFVPYYPYFSFIEFSMVFKNGFIKYSITVFLPV